MPAAHLPPVEPGGAQRLDDDGGADRGARPGDVPPARDAGCHPRGALLEAPPSGGGAPGDAGGVARGGGALPRPARGAEQRHLRAGVAAARRGDGAAAAAGRAAGVGRRERERGGGGAVGGARGPGGRPLGMARGALPAARRDRLRDGLLLRVRLRDAHERRVPGVRRRERDARGVASAGVHAEEGGAGGRQLAGEADDGLPAHGGRGGGGRQGPAEPEAGGELLQPSLDGALDLPSGLRADRAVPWRDAQGEPELDEGAERERRSEEALPHAEAVPGGLEQGGGVPAVGEG